MRPASDEPLLVANYSLSASPPGNRPPQKQLSPGPTHSAWARRSAFVNEWRCWRMEAEKNGGKVIAGAPFTLVGARLRSLLLSLR